MIDLDVMTVATSAPMSLISSHLFSELESLREENTGLKLQVLNRDQKLQHYEEENARLHEMLREFKRQVYGKKSERWESPEQGCLFNEAEVLARKPEDPNESAETDNKASASYDGARFNAGAAITLSNLINGSDTFTWLSESLANPYK